MESLSPNNQLYWFNGLSDKLTVVVELENKTLTELPKHYKFRMIEVNKESSAFCEVVGGANCGLRFYLSDNGISAMEPVE